MGMSSVYAQDTLKPRVDTVVKHDTVNDYSALMGFSKLDTFYVVTLFKNPIRTRNLIVVRKYGIDIKDAGDRLFNLNFKEITDVRNYIGVLSSLKYVK